MWQGYEATPLSAIKSMKEYGRSSEKGRAERIGRGGRGGRGGGEEEHTNQCVDIFWDGFLVLPTSNLAVKSGSSQAAVFIKY